MATASISAVEFNLGTYKVYDATTGQDVNATVTGNVYTVAGVTNADGSLRKLSMAELVMVVCLARAAEKEKAVIDLMKEMSDNTDILNGLTDIETKLIDGTSLNSITDKYLYQGNLYSAKEFLAIVLGGATPVIPEVDPSLSELWNQLSNKHIVDIEGSFVYEGTTYTKGYKYIYAMGISTYTPSEMLNFQSACGYADSLSNGAVLSDSDLQQLSLYCNISLPSGSTKADLVQAIDDKYKMDVMNDVLNKTSGMEEDPYVSNPSSYLPSSTDQLITDIESKMDSLNSFSQQKMIELQSETNKRDQAYDMITNILKSLNTVQVGIANNM